MKKEWKLYFDGFYEVSNFGEIRSIALWSSRYKKVIKRKRPFLLKQETTYDGYKRVVLCLYGKHFHLSVHRLVAELFVENPNNYPCVNHKDENTMNNRADNLEWCTAQYNSNYGTLPKRISERCKNNPAISKAVNQYSMDGELVGYYPSAKEAQRQTGINADVICRCCKGKARTSGGYRWSYAYFKPL